MVQHQVIIQGAREHNLKGVDVAFPRDALTTFTGVSGSGKSSLAHDTIYQEGQRRFLESLSAYARQFLGRMEKPKVDHIEGLSPTVAIDQKSVSRNPRSTVGTITETYDFFRLLLARLGIPHCVECGAVIEPWPTERIVADVLEKFGQSTEPLLVLAPIVRERKGEYRKELDDLRQRGFVRARIDGEVRRLDEEIKLDRYKMHTIEVVVDRLAASKDKASRLAESLDQAAKLTDGIVTVVGSARAGASGSAVSSGDPARKGGDGASHGEPRSGKAAGEISERLYNKRRSCPNGHASLPELEPRLFSFNSPAGACPACDGLGEASAFSEDLLVRDETVSLRERALACFTTDLNVVYSRITMDHVALVGKRFGFSVDTPWNKLSAAHKKIVLHGSDDEEFEFRWKRGKENFTTEGRERGPWRGIVPALEKTWEAYRIGQLERFRRAAPCPQCQGARLKPDALAVTFHGKHIADVAGMTVAEAQAFFAELQPTFREQQIGRDLFQEIRARLAFLDRVGLAYLRLDRRASTLSGGESQRIRLAAQLGAGLRGVLYVLDEPSIGLHARDNDLLLHTLQELRDQGNTLCVVEHDEATIRASDFVVDVGPGAGAKGGEVVVQGTPEEVAACDRSVTGAYLRGEQQIAVPAERRPNATKVLTVEGCKQHNLKDLTVRLPLERFVCVTGVSGSGKSTLINRILKRALRLAMHDLPRGPRRGEEEEGEADQKKAGARRGKYAKYDKADKPEKPVTAGTAMFEVPGVHKRITGLEHLDKVIEIDQTPIGRTPRSNPATYVGVWDHIRDLFASLPESKVRGYPKGRFSFNVKGGRCENCGGAGVKVLEMQFMAPVEVPCEECDGLRFNPETLQIRFKDKNIHDVLEMAVDEAAVFFGALPKIGAPLQLMVDVGLGYIRLGQPSTTLSGGEAQRIKLAYELKRPATGRTIYLLDEPTTGLHFADIHKLLHALQRLVDGGNSVVVIEHNLDVVKVADWVVDLGPEGGEGGGRLVAEGTPEQVAAVDASHTGRALRSVLPAFARAARESRPAPRRAAPRQPEAPVLRVIGARLHNLRSIDVTLPHNAFCVVTGVSGSGKTSLAFDTIFSEGQRRFVESLSTYARRFLGRLDKAPVDRIDGLGPAIAIDQKSSSRNPRSTVATTTEIHDYLRLLWARIGRPFCPTHHTELTLHTPSSIAKRAVTELAGQKGYVLAPIAIPESLGGKAAGLHTFLETLRSEWREAGFVRVLVDGAEQRLEEPILASGRKGKAVAQDEGEPEGGEAPAARAGSRGLPVVQLVIDRVEFKAELRTRIAEAVEQAAARGGNKAVLRTMGGSELVFTTDRSCIHCGYSFPADPHPRQFSFNHHSGACPTCDGLGSSITCDPRKLVNHPDRPLFHGRGRSAIEHAGAVFTWTMKPDGWYAEVFRQVAEAKGYDLDLPWEDLPKKAREQALWGTGEERYPVVFKERSARGTRTYKMNARWKGLGNQVNQWFQGNGNENTREALVPVMSEQTCPDCQGQRLNEGSRSVQVGSRSLPAVTALTVEDALAFFGSIKLGREDAHIAAEVLKEVRNRLTFLRDVGLEYLSLDRSAATLSGGEAQRIRLATQLGNRLIGVLYVLDEPTVGLHPRDTERLLRTLFELRDLGNTVIAVEHDEAVIRAADHVLDIGPGAGHRGGRVVASGTPEQVARVPESVTGRYLRGDAAVPVPATRRAAAGTLRLRGAAVHNLQAPEVEFPLGVLTAVTGVSGSGKSSLVMDALLPALKDDPPEGVTLGQRHGIEIVHVVDQEPIGATPASNPATYTEIFTWIRQVFAETVEARAKGLTPGAFSFNTRGGRCEACEGKGYLLVEMHFLADVWIECENCGGKRYQSEILRIPYRGKSIADVLEMEAAEAFDFFANHRHIAPVLRTMVDVGLGYLRLGQAAHTLSGGEAQRLKLVTELSRPSSRGTLYLLDEPTTGLHMDDVARLVRVLHALVDKGGTVIVIEHNLDVIAGADHVIDLGPEAGANGGRIVAQGTPEEVAAVKASHTGKFLAARLKESKGARVDAYGSG